MLQSRFIAARNVDKIEIELANERTPLAQNTAIAIVDDDDLVRASLASLLRSYGIAAEAFDSAASLLSGNPSRFDLVVADLQMPGMNGLDLRRFLSQRKVPLPVVIVTAYPERAKDIQRLDQRLHLLEKPVDSARLISCIEEILGRPIH